MKLLSIRMMGLLLVSSAAGSQDVRADVIADLRTCVKYYNGDGVPQDYVAALGWFRKAADQGDALAQHWTGGMYLNGDGVTQNYTEAMKWIRKDADQGLQEAKGLLLRLK